MISFKVLVILTVTIDLICCQGNQEIDECTNTFKTIGFTPGSGFFNYNFAKQFENFNEFLSYAKAKLNLRKTVNNSGTTSNNTIPESTFNDKKRSYSEMMYASEKEFLLGENSYLLPIYKRILKASNSVIIMNPPQFCRTMMNHIL
ncbi:PREDICTED: uncharacterized protein LOC107171169, partial [Diuraphis noxia]|uniref:uncharacterized protein LOC107171169 n=1 Tax=Diuraphis noxia TaxID=143948 RepID=UPI00076366BE